MICLQAKKSKKKKGTYARYLLNAKTKAEVHSSLENEEMVLTDGQIQILQEFLKKFKKADIPGKTKVIELAAAAIQSNWPADDMSFNLQGVEMVCVHPLQHSVLMFL
jgi:hypothetical protein